MCFCDFFFFFEGVFLFLLDLSSEFPEKAIGPDCVHIWFLPEIDCFPGLWNSFYFQVVVVFLKWTIFKIFIEFVTVLLLFYVLGFWKQGMWDLSFLTRD